MNQFMFLNGKLVHSFKAAALSWARAAEGGWRRHYVDYRDIRISQHFVSFCLSH